MAILEENEYEVIRRAILTDLTKADLPDAIIGQLPYGPRAIRWLVSKVSDAATQISTGRASGASAAEQEIAGVLTTAAVLYCASLLCPAVSRTTSITATAGDTAIVRPAFNTEKRAAELMGMAEEVIEEFLTASEAEERFTLFCRAPGRRA